MLRTKLLLVLCFIFCLFSSKDVFSQNPQWLNYTNGDEISALAIEGDFIWVGTTGGLVKIDRYSEENFFYNKLNSNLPGNRINCIAIDSSGNKWLGTDEGLAKFDGATWVVYDTSNTGLQLFTNKVGNIVIDGANNKWIMMDWKLIKFDNTNWTYYNPTGPGFSYINDFIIDKSENKWIGTSSGFGSSGGLIKFDGVNWSYYYDYNSDLPSNDVYSLAVDEYDNKWIGTRKGLAKFDGTHWMVYDTSNSGLPSNYITNISIDSLDIKWIATSEGLVKFDGSNWTVVDITNSGLSNSEISCIKFDESGFWIGSHGDGLVRFKINTWIQINTSESGIPSNCIGCIAIDSSNNKWIGSGNTWYGFGLVKFDGTNWTIYDTSNSGMPSNIILDIAIDEYENIWIGSYDYRPGIDGLTKYDGTSWTNYELPDDWIPFSNPGLVIDKTGNTWMSTYSGLVKFDGTNWTINNSGLPDNGISSLAVDSSNNIWVGTYGWTNIGGLAKFDGTTNWTVFDTTNSGLPGNSIYNISIDAFNNIWVITNGGLVKFDGTNWITNPLPGLENREWYGHEFLKIDKAGNKWVTENGGGFSKFDGTNWTLYNTSNSGLPDGVKCIEFDSFGNKWIGTASGLSVFNENGIILTVENDKFKEIIPSGYHLSQNYPNPFNPITNIQFSIPKTEFVTLKIYNLLGQEVATLVSENFKAGQYKYAWDASGFTSGLYFYHLETDKGFVQSKKLILMK